MFITTINHKSLTYNILAYLSFPQKYNQKLKRKIMYQTVSSILYKQIQTLVKDKFDQREKGITTTLRIYLYQIFHHTVIETYFEMLKSSDHENL